MQKRDASATYHLYLLAPERHFIFFDAIPIPPTVDRERGFQKIRYQGQNISRTPLVRSTMSAQIC
jgi:hypothetical protein